MVTRRVLGWIVFALLLALPSWGKTALELLQEAPAPAFKPGHTLLPLTRWAWPLTYELNVEMCQRWGYALDIDPGKDGSRLDNPKSVPARLAALAAADPKTYPVSVNLYRALFDVELQKTLPESTWTHDEHGQRVKRIFSPIMPDAVHAQAAALAVQPLLRLKRACPITLILNGAEYGLQAYGNAGSAWEKDPAITAARGDTDWDTFLSRQKARQELLITQAVREAVGPDVPFIYYVTGDQRRGISDFHWQWAFNFRYLHVVSDYPSWQAYYGADGRWVARPPEGEILTQMLNAAGQGIAIGKPLSYNWVCGGWMKDKVSDDATYEGFLRCLYLTGSLGAVAGYFKMPPGGFVDDVGETAPDWLRQIMILSRVHAQFTWLEPFLRKGTLLPGPKRHVWAKDQPAYEFPTGDPGLRVLARRLGTELLVCAWAADGADRDVTVELPAAGTTTLRARATGALYRLTAGAAPVAVGPQGEGVTR